MPGETTPRDWQVLAAWETRLITDREYADYLEARDFPYKPDPIGQLIIDSLRKAAQ